MKPTLRLAATTLSLVGLMSFTVQADTTSITAGLNAPQLDASGSAQVFWGPMVSQTSINLSGNANTNNPIKYAGTSITGSGGLAHCTQSGAPTSGPGGSSGPNDWYCNVNPPPPAPQVSFEDYRFLAQLQGNSCAGSSCLNSPLPSPYDTVCTVNGHPKVWFYDGDASFSGGYFCGVLVSKGKVTFTGGGSGDITATPPVDAWKQYEVGTPNSSGPDSGSQDQYPGDAGLHAVKPFRFSTGGGGFNGDLIAFNGYIYATTDFKAAGHTVILGAVQFGAGGATSVGGGTIFFTSATIFSPPPPGTVNQPIMTPPGGTFCAAVSVSLNVTTPGAAIYYTLDGSSPDPVVNSAAILYSGPITISATTTLKTIAVKSGMTSSAINTKTFTILSNCTPPPSIAFTANPTSILVGGSSVLSWTTQNATSVSINQTIGSVAVNGSRTVTPAVTTIYTLTATGPGGTTTAQATVTVGSTPPGDVCGDSQCTATESCSICAQDCGVCPPPSQFSFSPTSTSVSEDAEYGVMTVIRTLNTTSVASVQFASSNGSATAGQDYLGIAGTLTFNAGETTKTFDVPLIDDAVVEGNETVRLTLSSPVNGTLGSTLATLTILDNDTTNPPPPPPAPFISELMPYSAPVDFASSFTMRILGARFDTTGAQVIWNGNVTLPVISRTNTEIVVTVNPGIWNNTTGSYPVIVRNPGPVDSNAADFTVRPITGANAPPWVVQQPSANPNPVQGGKTTQLSMLGGTFSNNGSESVLTYTWTVNGPVVTTLSTNGTNAAKNAVATFSKIGTYTFQARITDTVTKFSVDTDVLTVVVNAGVGSVVVTPKIVTLRPEEPFSFTASVRDQFGAPLVSTVTWSASAGAIAFNSGSYTAPLQGQNITVTATSGTKFDSAAVTILIDGAALGDLNNSKVGPVPYKANSGDPGITFRNLPMNTTIRIFAMNGRIVQTLSVPGGGDQLWDLKNANLDRIASGVYLYMIESNGQKKEGKLVVIQ